MSVREARVPGQLPDAASRRVALPFAGTPGKRPDRTLEASFSVLPTGEEEGAPMTAAFNRELGLKINREVWNGRQLDKIADYFAEDFVGDYLPAFVWRGRQGIREAVERAYATFAGFREEVKAIVADEDRVVVHFTITGTHTGPWGPVPASGRPVAFDEIVIMTVRDGKVVHQTGVIDNVTGLRQVGVLPAART